MSWDLFYKNFWCKWVVVNGGMRNSGDSPMSPISDLCFVTGTENQRASRHGILHPAMHNTQAGLTFHSKISCHPCCKYTQVAEVF